MKETKRIKFVKNLVIDRKLWGRGSLLREDGRLCCLGHLGRANGASDKELSGEGYLRGELEKYAPPHFDKDYLGGNIQTMAAQINDDAHMSLTEKEYRLKILFKAHGIKLSFKGKSADNNE